MFGIHSLCKHLWQSVLRIRDVYPGSRIRLFSIPDPRSRIRTVSIPDPGSSSKNLSILTAKKAKKWFLSSKKYDPGCSSRIPDPDADFLPSRIPDPGVNKAPNPGSRIPDPDPQYWWQSVTRYTVGIFLQKIYTSED